MVFKAFAFEDGIAEILTKTEWKKCHQEYVLFDEGYLLFERYLQDKTSVYFPKTCRENSNRPKFRRKSTRKNTM